MFREGDTNMSEYQRIENSADAEQIYAEMIRVFGKQILLDKYRAVGVFLDIAPKMKEDAGYLMKAFDVGVPQHFAKASGLEKPKAAEFQKKLCGQGIPADTAIDLLEYLGHAVGMKVNIRPDYSKGGEIPYAAVKGDNLDEAIRKLDHIRWFLNNSSRYQMKGMDGSLAEMRKLMNNPGRNEAELIDRYNKLVHKFRNNPFEESFLFEGKKEAEFSSRHLGAYFVVVNQTPVALEFARQYGGSGFEDGAKSLKAKHSAMMKQVTEYQKEVSSISFGDVHNGGKKRKAVAFIVVSIIFMLLFYQWLQMRFMGSGIKSLFEVMKDNQFAVKKVFSAIPVLSHPAAYVALGIVTALILLCAVILIIKLIVTIRNIGRVQDSKGPENRKKKLTNIFGTSVPKELDGFMEKISQYNSGKLKSLELTPHDYSQSVKEIDTLKNIKISEAKGLVAGGAKAALAWMIILTAITSIMSATKMRSAVIASASELGNAVTFKEELSETVIPISAAEYNGHYYAIYDDTSDWWEAYARCIMLGGHLVTISSAEEANVIENYVMEQELSDVYIGMVYMANSEGVQDWIWVTHEDMAYTDWTETEPDIGDAGDCIYATICKSDGYQWRALMNDYTNYYVCEWESLDAGKVDQTVMNIPAGSLSYNGHYYAVLDGAEDYASAVEICSKAGGYLCMIDDADENTNLYNYIVGLGYEDVYFGYSDENEEGNWIWSYTGEAGGYANWAENEPNGYTSENYAMYYNGSAAYAWNDGEWGGTDSLFLCEWDLQ